jgi:hypothetical protein
LIQRFIVVTLIVAASPSFAAEGIEVIALSAADNPDYHKTTDVAARINAPGLERVINLAEPIVRLRDAR